MQFSIDERLGLTVTTVVGNLTPEDLLAHATRLAATPDRPPRELVDFTDYAAWPFSLDAVRTMGEFLRDNDSNEDGGQLALVGSDDEVFGAFRVFEAHRDHSALTIKVFRDRDEALRWLGIDPADFSPPSPKG